MSCYACRFYTGESFLPCTINAEVAQTSPQLGCWEFEKDPNPWGFWESELLNPPHVDNIQIGCVPIDGWKRLVYELLYEDYNFSESNFVEGVVVGHSLWRDRQTGQIVGYAEAWLIEHKEWFQNPDPLSLEGGLVLEFMSLFE